MSIDPVTLATVTSALSYLGLKAADGALSKVGQDLWNTVKNRFGWTNNPSPENLAVEIATRLKDDESLTNELTDLLKSQNQVGNASALVGRIEAGKVVVAATINVSGDFKM